MIPQTVFVTGGTGLVGSHLIYELLNRGYRVKALIRPSSSTAFISKMFGFFTGKAEYLLQQIEWVEGDLQNFGSISAASEGCSQLYHAAAVVSFNKSDRTGLLSTNVNGTANIVNVCLDKNIPLCHVSSIGALGRGEPGVPVTEKDMWQTSKDRSVYSCSKYKSEMEVWRGIAEGLKATIVNPSVILGPGDWNNGSSVFFSRVHKGLNFYTPGVTGFVDVRDVARCMVLLMEKGFFNERFIISAGDLSYQQLFDFIATGLSVKKPSIEAKPWMLSFAGKVSSLGAKLTGKRTSLSKETIHSAFQKHYYSNDKIKNILSYQFIDLEQSIQDCCRFFLRDISLLS